MPLAHTAASQSADTAVRPRDIGLALSGGGFRAAAFHLGCLRALHDRDVLDRVQVVFGISGGALLAALWAYGPADFVAFDEMTVALLRRGFQGDLIRRALRPGAIVRNLASATGTLAASVGHAASIGRTPTSARPEPPCLRRATRTDALVGALTDQVFGTRRIDTVTHPGLQVVLTACDLRTGSAVRFGSAYSACSRYGVITDPVDVATAVAASAAFPLLLPALERTFTFRDSSRCEQQHPVLLTDGGVYDNLALTPLEPGRSPAYTSHVYDMRYVVACDAGRGPLASAMPHFWPRRVARSFEVTHRRAQDGGRARLHQAAHAGQLDGFVWPTWAWPTTGSQRRSQTSCPASASPATRRTSGQWTKPTSTQSRFVVRNWARVLLTHYCPRFV